jgi:phosphatidate cytidylyltransferase
MGLIAQRVATALVLAPVAVLAILWLPTPWFAGLLAVVVLAGAWEWGRLVGWERPRARALYVGALGGAMAVSGLVLDRAQGGPVLAALGLAWWLAALWLVVRRQRLESLPPTPAHLRATAGALTLVPAWAALAYLHGYGPAGPYWVLFLAIVTWAADTGAFFAGRRWGRRRLAGRVSPGKSWEGVAGGLAGSLLVAALAAVALGLTPVAGLGALLLVTTGAVLASVVGDLSESLFKREAGLKDSGSLLPGHGGVLDRIDSLTASAPVFVLGLLWLGVVT